MARISSSPRVEFATTVRSCRPPRDDELSVMRAYARHASHCRQCADPFNVWKTSGELCDKGHAYARDVAKYIYSKGGRPHSVIDKDSRGERNEIEVPVEYEVIRNLTKAFHQGLNLKSKKPIVSQDSRYYVSERRPEQQPSTWEPQRQERERRVYDGSRNSYGVEITPGSSRRERTRYQDEDRNARNSKRATVHMDSSKGSLYYADEAALQSRRRYEDEPVMIIREPNRRRGYVM